MNPTFVPATAKPLGGNSTVVPMSANKANVFRNQMSTKVQTPRYGQKPKHPPKIDIMAEAQEIQQQQQETIKPAWQSSVKKEAVVINKMGVNFGKPIDTGGPKKSAIELAKERKRAKKEAEEAVKRAAEEAERTKFDHMPEWKKAMFRKKEAQKKEASKGDDALMLRSKEIEAQFADLPAWQQERAIKKEKRRILQEEGVIVP